MGKLTMHDSDDLDQWQGLLAGYVLGDLSSEDAMRVHQYLSEHPEKMAELQQLQAAMALTALALPEASPPDSLKARVLESATHTPQTFAKPQARPVWRNHKKMVAGAIAASAIAALGILNLSLSRQLAIAQQEIDQLKANQQRLATMEQDMKRYQKTVALLHQPNNRLMALTAAGKAVASGSLVIVPTQNVAVLTLQNLPVLPTEQMYQLWAVKDGKKMPCPQFMPNAQGEVFLQLSANDLMDSSEVVVTVEPAGKMPQPTGEMVLSGT
jgi:anti-sigma-K factor RskA